MKGIGMKKFSGFCAATAFVAAATLQGCVNYHTQEFGGEKAGVFDLQNKELYFMPAFGPSFYERIVRDINSLGNGPEGDTLVTFQDGVREVALGAAAINFYGQSYSSIFIGEDGTIGFGGPGNNASLAAHFAQPQVSLLPVDAVGSGEVRFQVANGDSVAVTYDGVTAGGAPATAQAQFFLDPDKKDDLSMSYLSVSDSVVGVVGLSNAQLAGVTNADEIARFLADVRSQNPLSVGTLTGTL